MTVLSADAGNSALDPVPLEHPTQAAASELREHRIHVALLIVDAVIDRSGEGDAHSADPQSLADAVAYLASQSPRAMTHELQVTPALDNWTP